MFSRSNQKRRLRLGDMWRQFFERNNMLGRNVGEKLSAVVVKAAIKKSRESGNGRFFKKNFRHFMHLGGNT